MILSTASLLISIENNSKHWVFVLTGCVIITFGFLFLYEPMCSSCALHYSDCSFVKLNIQAGFLLLWIWGCLLLDRIIFPFCLVLPNDRFQFPISINVKSNLCCMAIWNTSASILLQ